MKKINIFVSYSHRNKSAVKFVTDFYEYVKPSKNFDYRIYYDKYLRTGQEWERKLLDELNKSDVVIALLSTSFLDSQFIQGREVPLMLNADKIVLPVGFAKINIDFHNLKEFGSKQIFFLDNERFSNPRSYLELKGKQRIVFIDRLFIELELSLLMKFGSMKIGDR